MNYNLLITTILCLIFQQGLSQSKIIAHRGFWNTSCGVPQNSVAALAKAQEHGFYGSEVDIHLSKDKVPVLYHDNTLAGKRINNYLLEELRKHKLLNGERLPTLEEYITQYKTNTDIVPVLELKPQPSVELNKQLVDEVVKLLNKTDVRADASFISFSVTICLEIKKQLPDAHVEYLNGDKSPKEIKELGLSGIDYHYNKYLENPNLAKEANELGLSTNSWTVNDPKIYYQLQHMGVQFITTDEPLYFKDSTN